MKLISQRTKQIMEECKKKARDAGLQFQDETLEYVVTNRDLLELSPKVMIPTMYDYWVHDVVVHRSRRIYEVYPSNPYETVINTRPAISFYNDNNPDWLNVMIFYHVLGHIDFFQNNIYFKNTWRDDFCGLALADKRLITRLREELGEKKRRVDYVIEFTRGIDNLVGYYTELNRAEMSRFVGVSKKVEYYFGEFLRRVKATRKDRAAELEHYNELAREYGVRAGEKIFFMEVEKNKYQNFSTMMEKYYKKKKKKSGDLIRYIMDNSEFLNKSENVWMKQVMEVVRDTSLYFQPQIRTKIMNEGWASFWHQRLFLRDRRMAGHEVDFARVNAKVMAMPRVGLNPYGLGCNLYKFMFDLAEKGKISYDFQQLKSIRERADYDKHAGSGMDFLFRLRENLNDYMFINFLPAEDFQDFVAKHKLFVAGKRFNPEKYAFDIFVKSRNGEEYRQMLNRSLYHPPYIEIDREKTKNNELYLNHHFEERTLRTRWIFAVLMGIEYLWGGSVKLETTEFEVSQESQLAARYDPNHKPEIKKKRYLYTMSKRKLKKAAL